MFNVPYPAGCVGNAGTVCNAAFGPGLIRLAGAAVPGLVGTVNLADITLHALVPPKACSELTIVPGSVLLVDSSFDPMDAAFDSGMICVIEPEGAVGIDHDGSPANINPGPANVPVGSTVTVGVVIEPPAPNLGSWTIDVHYQPASIQPTGCTTFPDGALAGVAAVCNELYGPGVVRTVGADALGVTGTYNVAGFTFRAVGPAGSCSPLHVVVDSETDAGSVQRLPAIYDGQVCITNASADLNGNGRVDLRDVARIALAALRGQYAPQFDLNGDHKLNFQDVAIALAQLLGRN